jgi:SAM-dependent methyltransferase
MKQLTTQNGYWDRVAREKRFSHPLQLNWLTRHLVSKREESTILDYGCGYGRTLAELRLAGYHKIIGVDFSAGMLARCRLEQPGSLLARNDGRNFPLTNGSWMLCSYLPY